MRIILLLSLSTLLISPQDPPYAGTVWISPNIVTTADPTSFSGFSYLGRGERTVYDRRPPAWITVNAFLFEVRFDDGTTSEFIINPEFGSREAAEALVARYAPPIGRLSTHMRRDMDEVWVNGGDEAFGGGNRAILIHTVYGDRHIADGFIEELLIHESGHTSFDADHAQSPGWLAAQSADPEFISTYARDNPLREDVSESLLPYYAVKFRPDRIPQADVNRITEAIPNRMAYFDDLNLDWYPLVTSTSIETTADLPSGLSLGAPYPNPTAGGATLNLDVSGSLTVRASVVDVLGREVATLFNGVMSAGPQVLTWDGTGSNGDRAPSGTYLILVDIEGRVEARTLAHVGCCP